MVDTMSNKPKIESTNNTSSVSGSLPKAQSKTISAPKSNSGLSSGSKPLSQPKAQPTLNKQKSSELAGSKIQPGSPTLNKPDPKTHMSQPFGVTKGLFESKKRFNKKVNDTFKESGQPTLLVSQGKKDQIKINPAFDKTKEINQALENRKKIMGQGFAPKEFNQSPKAIESPDVPHDEDYERSWGPQDNEENETPKQARTFKNPMGEEQTLDGSGLEMFSNEDGSFTIQDGSYILSKYNSVNELPEAGFTQEEINELTTDGSLYFPTKEEQERKQASNLFGTDLSQGQETVEPLSKDDEPGSVVVTPRLVDFTKNFLLQRGFDDTFASSVADNLYKDHKQADYYRQQLKAYMDSKNGGNK